MFVLMLRKKLFCFQLIYQLLLLFNKEIQLFLDSFIRGTKRR